ncbi:zinc-dependent metalloprotease [Ideonella sp. DXS29W]|uniref:Zinc-dependent metalloprotease n=1 Tax=Ideonella lacteola TaxID=2984193 RepID=A0ABU9BN26_9BURK
MLPVFADPNLRHRAGIVFSSTSLLLSLVACSTPPAATAPAAGPAPAASPAAAAAPAEAASASGASIPGAPVAAPSAPKPGAASPSPASAAGSQPAFAAVIKDAKRSDGLLPVWQKDEKVWFELKPDDFNKPLFLSPKLSNGIGEQAIFGGSMLGLQYGGRPQIVEFRRVHNQVMLVARNERYIAPAGSPEARSVAHAFSDSLLGSVPVASQAHPDSKAILIEANPIFVADLMGLGIQLQRTYRQNYGFDGRNSAFSQVRTDADAVTLDVNLHFSTASLASPVPGAPSTAPVPILPNTLPDPRSMFLGLHYSLAALPAQPMAPRKADPRVGYFNTTVLDFGNDTVRTPNRHYVRRWRLEKKDPTVELSEPVKPITYWIDRDVPERYRDAITRGVLAWNAAFERIGFKNAIVVQQQPEDAAFDTLDLRYASIRWMTNADPAFGAIGPSHVDPRTGEILDADIGIESLSSRNRRTERSQVLAGRPLADASELLQADGGERLAALLQHGEDALHCQHGAMAAEQLNYALDVLSARGDIDPASPEAEAFVQAYLFDVTMHEVGHTLGLRHNFRSSRIYSDRQLSDPDFTRTHSLAGSVMEYAPVNLGRPGEPVPAPFQTTLGPYDYWAIEYAYKPFPAEMPAAEQEAELQRIAARSPEPLLAYGTDEDNLLGYDPETLVFDLGDDPLVFAKKRIAIARDLFERQERRILKPTEDYTVLRRALGYALRDATRAAGVLARQIGGLRTLRDFPGSGRDPLQPVPAAVQRDALDTLAKTFLSAEGFRVSPSLARKLAPDYLERFGGVDPVPTDFSPGAALLDLQRALLNQLMSEGLAARLLDAQAKADSPKEAFSVGELYRRVTGEIWSDLARPGDIPVARRELQREHLSRLANLLLRPSSTSRADARGLLRQDARALLERITAASRRADLSVEARGHLADSADTLRAALNATVQRAGV